MFYKSILKIINNSYSDVFNNQFDKIDPNLIRYFQVEHGKDWKSALNQYIYKKDLENLDKAA